MEHFRIYHIMWLSIVTITRMNTITILSVIAMVIMAHASYPYEDDFVCSEIGRHADESDQSCRHYHFCDISYGGQWVKSSYNCPEGTIFDRDSRHCTTNARCHHDSLDNSVSESDFDDDEFECRKPGLFDDIYDVTCGKYYECKKNHRGELYAIQYPCPPPSRFDPKQGHCSNRYVCPRHFTCTRMGRFDDATDENNKKYFLCVKKKNGDFVQTVYSCPLFSRFDQIDNVCVVPNDSLDDEYDVHDHTLPNEYWDHLNTFTCEARGFFRNDADPNCKSFHFCDVNSDGKIFKHTLTCPRGYGWNKNINLCAPGYSC